MSLKDHNSKIPTTVHHLRIFLDDNKLLRCRGRIEHSSLPQDTQYPILLPRNSYLTKLIVQTTHLKVLHNVVRNTLTEVRQHYWIPSRRQNFTSILRKCVTCRKVQGQQFQSVTPPPQPKLPYMLTNNMHPAYRSGLCRTTVCPRNEQQIYQSLHLPIHVTVHLCEQSTFSLSKTLQRQPYQSIKKIYQKRNAQSYHF